MTIIDPGKTWAFSLLMRLLFISLLAEQMLLLLPSLPPKKTYT